jgi:hypothetical protein
MALLMGTCSLAQTVSVPIGGSLSMDLINSPSGYTAAPFTISSTHNSVAMQFATPWTSATSLLTASPPAAAAGYTVTYTWTLAGDILNAATGLQTGTGSTIKLSGFNSNNRHTANDLGQGKGRVILTSTWLKVDSICPSGLLDSTTQSAILIFDVYKIFGAVNNVNGIETPLGVYTIPALIGPACLQLATKYTFSVDPGLTDDIPSQIGTDRYLWDITTPGAITTSIGAGASVLYYSADSSEITIMTGPIGSGTIVANPSVMCNFGICNFPTNNVSGKAYAVLQMGVSATAPSITITSTGLTTPGGVSASPTVETSYPASICVNTVSTAPYNSTITFAVSPVSGYTYTWTWSPSTWNSTPVQPVVASSVTITTDNNPGIVTLTSVGPCGTQVQSVINVNRRYNSTAMFTIAACNQDPTFPITITGGANSSGNISSTFNTSYTSLPSGWSVANSSYSSTGVTVTSGTAAPANTYTINIGNACTVPSLVYSSVTIQPSTPIINTPTSNCGTSGTTVSLTTTSVTGVNYIWSVTGGGTGYLLNGSAASSVTTTVPNVTVTIGTAGIANVTLTEQVGSCPSGVSNQQSIGITMTAPAIVAVSTCFNYGVAGSYTYKVAQVPGTTLATNYTWSCTAIGSSISASALSGGFDQVTVTIPVGSSITNFDVSCTITGGTCGTVSATPYTSIVSNGGITADTATAGGHTFYVLSSAPTGVVSYSWMEGATVKGTSATYDATTLNGGTVGVVYCLVTLSNGCKDTFSTAAGRYKKLPTSPPGTGSIGNTNNLNNLIKLFPNPNKGRFTLVIPIFNESAKVTFIDASGREFMTKTLSSGDNEISEEGLATGDYTLLIRIDGNIISKPIVITR